MTANSVILPVTALLFAVVFGGAVAFYVGGTEAVPQWFRRLNLFPAGSLSPARRVAGMAIGVAFLGLAEWAVVANLDPATPLSTTLLVAEQAITLSWLLYLGKRVLRQRQAKT